MGMKRKIVSLLLCLVMALSLVPTAAFAAEAPAKYTITVNGGKAYTDYSARFELTEAEAGQTVVLAASGIDFVGWEVVSPTELTISGGTMTSFTMPASNVVVTAKHSETPAAKTYDVWVNGVQFTEDQLTISCGDGTATYDPDTNTVTLDGAQITRANNKGAIYAGDQADRTLTVNVIGDSSIHLDSDTNTIGGIYADTLVLNASKNLDICVDNKDSGGIYTNGRDVRFPDSGDVTISGSGNVTINSGDNGIYSTGSVTFSSSGDVTIAARSNGIYSYNEVTISGSGNVNITSQNNYGIFEYGDVTISASGDVKIQGFYSGVYIGKVGESGRNLILSGSGKVDIGGAQRGVTLCGDGKVFLNGTGSPIKLHAGSVSLAVYNGDTEDSPVVGSSLDKYDVTGDPASNSVVYTLKTNVWVNGEQFTGNKLTISCGSGTATYDPDTNTVTLDGAQITKASETGAVRAKGALTVNVVGDSSITLDSSIHAHGIFADRNLTLTGPGNLDIRVDGDYDGLETIVGNVVIAGSGDVTVNAGTYGVYTGEEGYLNITGSGDVDIYGECNGAYGGAFQLVLNGTGGSVKLSGGYKAFNDEDGDSIVVGNKLSDYDVTGDPASTSVIYCKHENTELRGFVAPTCTAEGCSGDVYCMDCGKKVGDSNPIPKMEHYYVTSAMHDPTCTEDGYGEMTCKYCGDKFTFKTDDAYGHHEVTDKAVAATYAKTGKTAGSHCDICGAVLTAQTEEPMLTLKQPTVTLSATSTGITVKWTKVTGATGYQVYRKAGSATTWGDPITTITSGSTVSYTDANRTNGTKYQYKVRAIAKNSVGTIVNKGAYSAIKTTYFVARPAISSVTNTSTGITVKWGKITGATGYKLYRKAGSATTWTRVTTITDPSTVSYTDTNRTNGTKYQYKVVAIKTVSGTDYASAYSTVKTTYRLSRPTISSATNSGAGKITLKWNKNDKATGYQVKYVVGTTTKTVKVTSNATLSKTLSSLTKGSTYKVYVRSYKTVGSSTYYSAYSAYKSVKVAQ